MIKETNGFRKCRLIFFTLISAWMISPAAIAFADAAPPQTARGASLSTEGTTIHVKGMEETYINFPYSYTNNYTFVKNRDDADLTDIVFELKTQVHRDPSAEGEKISGKPGRFGIAVIGQSDAEIVFNLLRPQG
jgi:hypothetical protein